MGDLSEGYAAMATLVALISSSGVIRICANCSAFMTLRSSLRLRQSSALRRADRATPAQGCRSARAKARGAEVGQLVDDLLKKDIERSESVR